MQYLYEKYSALDFKDISDKPKAILGLQKRIARQFDSGAQYGALWRWLERTILWRAEVPGSLAKIEYEPGNLVPSWSWMAYSGAIGFLEIRFGRVKWMKHIHPPITPESNHGHWDGRLQVESSDLTIKTSELMRRSFLDCQIHEPVDSSWRCVVVGRGKTLKKEETVSYYVLLIRPSSTIGTNECFVRVGVATLLAEHCSARTRSVYLI